MAQDVRLEQINKTQSVDCSSNVSGTSTNSAASNIDFSSSRGAQDDINLDNKNSNKNNGIKLRSLDEVYKSVEAVLKQYGISVVDAKSAHLLEKISGRKPEELVKMDNKELNNIVLCLTKALEKLSAKSKTPDMEEVIKLANDYNIATMTGWTIDGFERKNAQNSDSLSARLGKFCGKKNFDITKASPEERKQVIKAYFNDYFKKIKGKSKDQILKLQLQDFGKLLINSSEEEKVCFKEVIKELSAEVKGTALEATFDSILKLENKIAFANSWDGESIKELASADRFGNTPSKESIESSTKIIYEHKSAENIVKTHKELDAGLTQFLEENKEAIEKINKKIKNNEELTKEEQKLYTEYQGLKAISTGEIVGTAENNVIPDELQKNILILLNNDNYNHGEDYYRDVLNEVNTYIQEHEHELGLSADEYKELLDNATNGNYSIVANDTKNGTTTELNSQPSVTVEECTKLPEKEEESSYSSESFYSLPEQQPDIKTTIEAKKEQIKNYGQTTVVDSKSNNTITSNNLSECIKKQGLATVIESVLASPSTPGFMKTIVKKLYAQKRSSEQISILKSIQNQSSFCELLTVTKDETILKMGKNEKFANVYMTKVAHEKYENTAKKYKKNNEELLA